MAHKISRIFISLFAAVMISGCVYGDSFINITSTEIATVDSPKTGTFSCSNIASAFSFNIELGCPDAVAQAMKDGGITKIHYVEKTEGSKPLWIFWFDHTLTVTVHGE